MRGMKNYKVLNQLFNNLDVAIILIGRDDGIIKYLNIRVCRDLDRSVDDLIGKHYRQVFQPDFVTVYDNLHHECEEGKNNSTVYYWAEKALWEHLSLRTITPESNPYVLLSISIMSEIALAKYRLDNITYFDSLLELPNGAKLEEDINELASLETVALIYFDIERFEDINDLYGWDNGDYLLKQVRHWLMSSETRQGRIYRVNNGFAILGRKVSMEDAHDRSREIVKRFSRPWALPAGDNNLSLYLTINLGIVYGKYIKNEMRNLLLRTKRQAQKSEAGYAVYDERADWQAKLSIQYRDTLINCIFNDMEGFEVYYQPIVNIRTRHWEALEALCRWTMPDGNKMSPVYFIGMAEQLGLIDRLDAWVRRTAMKQCVSLGLSQRKFILDVNFSPVQEIDDIFINSLLRTLDETGFPPRKLKLEIIESAKMNFDEKNVNGLLKLKENGIILCLDDFGTGYSSFANLLKIPATSIKAEKFFLDGIEQDTYRQYFFRMLTDTSHFFGMELTAEGVETKEQLELLDEFGVDYVQGFFFSQPLSYEELRHEVWRFQR